MSLLNRAKTTWLSLPETWRKELASAFHTFVPAFVSAMILFFQTTSLDNWSKDTVLALMSAALLAAFRSGFKALSVWFFSHNPDTVKEDNS